MTKELLESYTSKIQEIKEIKERMKGLKDDDSMVVSDVIRYDRLLRKYEEQIDVLEKDCEVIERYVEEIEDSLTRRIFRAIFIDGNTQSEASKKIHIDRSIISRKINNYIKRG